MGDYCVYRHLFPNDKCYIGISKDPEHRWRNGDGYKKQTKMAKAIKHYGWDNVKHEVLIDRLEKEQAEKLERILIQAYDSIENGYNVSIGGESIIASYLNAHVLYMIRESHRYDVKYGRQQPDDCIVAYAEKAKYNKDLAEKFNYCDELIETQYDEYKRYSGVTISHDLGEARVDCYWWTMLKLLEGNPPKGHEPYWEWWLKETGLL